MLGKGGSPRCCPWGSSENGSWGGTSCLASQRRRHVFLQPSSITHRTPDPQEFKRDSSIALGGHGGNRGSGGICVICGPSVWPSAVAGKVSGRQSVKKWVAPSPELSLFSSCSPSVDALYLPYRLYRQLCAQYPPTVASSWQSTVP